MIATLRTRINELNEIIRNAVQERSEKMEELERLLHDEARKNELIGIITSANLNVEQLEAIVNSINNIADTNEVPTINIPNEVQIENQTEVQTDNESERPIHPPLPDELNNTILITDENGNEAEITEEMMESDMTIVGIRHQHAWNRHNFTPTVGEHLILSKETETANCFALYPEYEVEQHPELGEDIFIGILPTNGSPKTTELEELNLPCKTHQEMWNTDELNDTYVITGVIPGRFITLKKYIPDTVTTENVEDVEDVEETSSNINLSERLGVDPNKIEEFDTYVTSEDEARHNFNNRMPDHCVITSVDNIGSHFVVRYDNMRCNTMEEIHQVATFPIILE